MKTLNLNGAWQVLAQPLSSSGERGLKKTKRVRAGWIAARVPGEIHLDLMRAGLMPEPLVGTNAPSCRWPEKKSWWYRQRFKATAALLAHECLDLVFDGLDLDAQIFLNGKLVGESSNAFVPVVFNVRHHLRRGGNELVVRLTSGVERTGIPINPTPYTKEEPYRNRYYPGMHELRKAQFSHGWDWVDSLPNIGIWRGVRLEARSGVILHDIRLDTVVHTKDVYLKMHAIVENPHPWGERACVLEISIKPPRGKSFRRRYDIDAVVGRTAIEDWIPIPNPQLWWPSDMGDQPLYQVTATIRIGTKIADQRAFEIGLRTVEINRDRTRPGRTRFAIRINGEDVFCKGGNWIPCDAIVARATPGRYEHLIAAARDANMNMLRIWGGGIYEDDAFYAACNRAGILVWQDFMFACSDYPDDRAAFRNEMRDEAEAAIRRLRHHPCIALWCGNNENQERHAHLNRMYTFGRDRMNIGGHLLYNQVLADACRHLDPERPYWPGSPMGGERPTYEYSGDTHWWHEATMNADMNRRIHHETYDECTSGFVSEYGVIGPVHEASMKQYLSPKEMKAGSLARTVHTNTFERETIPAAIKRHYAEPKGLDLSDYILYGQMFQAFMYGGSVESLRFRKRDKRDDCQGALIWMYNDCWGETGWTLIDYYLRRKASYYWFKRACRPVKVIIRRRGRKLVTRVVNDTLDSLQGTVEIGWMRIDGTASERRTRKVRIPANGAVELPATGIPSQSERDPREWIYAATLRGKGIEADQALWKLVPFRELALSQPDVTVVKKGRQVTLQSKVFCHGVHLRDKGRAILSDNYVDLLPGVPMTLQRIDGKAVDSLRFHAVIPGSD